MAENGVSKFYGDVGETVVADMLQSLDVDYRWDFYLPKRSGVVQIDLCLMTGNRVVVAEVKNWSGTVLGSVGETYWTRIDFEGKRSFFYNPILQNKAQVDAVSLGFPVGTVTGMVVFAGTARFPKGMPKGAIALEALPSALEEIRIRTRPRTADLEEAWSSLEERIESADQMALSIRHAAMRSNR